MKERASGLRRLPVSAWVFDTVLALAAAGISTAYFVSEPMARGLPRGTLALGYGLALLHTLPLAARRRFPGPCLPSSWPAGWPSPPLACRRSFSDRPSWWRSIRWRPTAAGRSRWPAWDGRQHRLVLGHDQVLGVGPKAVPLNPNTRSPTLKP